MHSSDYYFSESHTDWLGPTAYRLQ